MFKKHLYATVTAFLVSVSILMILWAQYSTSIFESMANFGLEISENPTTSLFPITYYFIYPIGFSFIYLHVLGRVKGSLNKPFFFLYNLLVLPILLPIVVFSTFGGVAAKLNLSGEFFTKDSLNSLGVFHYKNIFAFFGPVFFVYLLITYFLFYTYRVVEKILSTRKSKR